MPIAIGEFIGSENEIGKNIFKTIAGDLEGSGLFKLIDRNAFL